jgi:hypothetical protein
MADSTHETLAHIRRVQVLLFEAIHRLQLRAMMHDGSKLVAPEKGMFDRYTPLPRDIDYGSDAYHQILEEMRQTALSHHYANNRHHPEHFPDGIRDMTLLDLLEMLIDWKAASERHASGDIRRSLEINAGRFEIGDDLKGILAHTIEELWGE